MKSIDFSLMMNPEEVSTVIKEFIKTYVHTSGYEDVVLGLSGGIDSAVVAVLCIQALGRNHVHGVFMPDETTPPQDRKDLELLIQTVGISCTEINITPILQSIMKVYPQKINQLTLANIKTRIRMVLLFTFANENRSLVCGTSNKSEFLIGYFTKYGDGGVDLQPLGDLYKTQVFHLAQYLNISEQFLSKPPSAGLWAGQTDEKEIGLSYQILDKILYGLELKIDDAIIQKEAGVQQKDIDYVKNRWKTSQHKRRMPLIPKIGIRTPGFDWRSSIQKE
ncbi:MAG: NAD+ synthase [Candidatus Thermoplasmatota archaeon]